MQSAVLAMIDSVCLSVCLSERLSHAGIMQKRHVNIDIGIFSLQYRRYR